MAELRRLRRDNCVEEVPKLLRRIGLAAYGRHRVVALTGTAWINFLNSTQKQDCFDDQNARLLLILSYGPAADVSAETARSLFDQAAFWIGHHRRLDA